MENIKAVIFDFGGVLIDWNPYYLYRKVLPNDNEIAGFLQETGILDWNYTFDQGYPFSLGIAELSRRFPQRAELIRMFDERWLETLGTTFDATIELVKAVKAHGIPVYGLTNWSSEKFEQVRPQFEFMDLFKDIVVSGNVKIAKPDTRIYTLLLERNGLSAADCLYIDDSKENIRAARQVGLQSIEYQSSQKLREEMTKHGVL